MLDAFASHDHQTKVIEGEYLGRRLIAAQRFLQSLHYALAVAALFHVDQIEDDNSAEIAQANLACDFFDCFHVRARNRVFQAGRAAPDKLAGVHVDRNQGLGLVDNQVTAGAQPHARLDGFVDFALHAIGLQDRFVTRIEFDSLDHLGLHPVHKLDDALILVFGIDPDRGEVFGELIAQNSLH